MRKTELSVLITIVSIALALPMVSSWFLSSRLAEAAKLMQEPLVSLPESIGEWHRSHDVRDSSEPNVVRVEYCNIARRRLFVILQRSSTLGSMHDLHDCLVSTGGIPTLVKHVAIADSPKPFKTSLIRTKIVGACTIKPSSTETTTTINRLPETAQTPQDLHRFLSVVWFQNALSSAPSRWEWRCDLMRNVLHIPLTYHQVEVTVHESPDMQDDVHQLSQVAEVVHQLPL